MLVSVIIPCYNVEAYISGCIESVLAQTYSPLEIICVDNNSSDKTHQILLDYQTKYGDKLSVYSELKKGAPAARNKGLVAAKGEWIQFLDADDIILPEKIALQMRMVSEKKDIGFISGTYYSQPVKGDKIVIPLKFSDSFKALFVTNLGITSANLFNAAKVRMVNGWDESLSSSQESELMFKLLKNKIECAKDIEATTIVRERESGQISQSDPKKKWIQYIALRLQIINFLKSSMPDYFVEEKGFYYQNLFSQVRTLAKYDLDIATAIYKENFEKDFAPASTSGFSIYSKLFALLGFRKAENFKKIVSKIKG